MLQLTSSALLLSLQTQHRRNATRLCDHVIPEECIRRDTPEICISQLTGQVLGDGAAAASGSSSSRRTAAIAAPVAIAGALVLPVGCWLCFEVGSATAARNP
jgi:hypothetical protein